MNNLGESGLAYVSTQQRATSLGTGTPGMTLGSGRRRCDSTVSLRPGDVAGMREVYRWSMVYSYSMSCVVVSTTAPFTSASPFPSPSVGFVVAQYGQERKPLFLAESYREAVQEAARQHKFLLVYLHSPLHQDTSQFCRCGWLVCRPFHAIDGHDGGYKMHEGFVIKSSLFGSCRRRSRRCSNFGGLASPRIPQISPEGLVD